MIDMPDPIKNELVSVIMPSYNSKEYIKAAINSVLNQSYTNLELIIINDSSIDGTLEIIESFTDQRIKIINSISNEGVALSRNKGISLSRGKYISFLDSDDLWEMDKLANQIRYLNDGFDLVCSNYYTFFEDDDSTLKIRISPQIITYADMLKSNFIGNLTGIYNAEKIGKVYQKKLGHEDYIMWLDIISKTKSAYCIQKPLAKYRLSKKSLSSNKFIAIQWQWKIYRNILKFPWNKSLYFFSHYILNAFKKRR
ncbi:Putative teichuronic acid biosynthesis glycosyltransferase TuaG [Providencia alcalifaciens]|nr:Putative teichuronic acid biosynthesis glycosyltransferase TuaG [Providencia alcalifaciens]CAG9434482.1 Putative teichuronic acid biosynthesis glycosyltransferase TuaG [Providencia alcalifaciens]CAG9434589.1 Putative teichuronic acid biosynthesis glycosyltransferase TuaG [Providencia alcalifaciens]CAG9435064.1 Putative teichuronic acid biosynthesis glycosyltransferase TuaG [Providencia alcalifaciens]CAG9435141.1 Putative teichuronic acid biosynthesis glycosyltransferase TuaG [Providencia alc